METTTAPIVDDHLLSAIDAAIEGILQRIIHKVSTLLGGEGISKEVTTRSGGQIAHSSLAEADSLLDWGVETQDPDLTFLSSLVGRRVPPAQVAHDSMVGAQDQGLSPWGRTWAGPEPAGMAMSPPHQRNQVWAQEGPYTSPASRPVADRPFTATSPSQYGDQWQGTRAHGRETGQVQPIVGDGKQPTPHPQQDLIQDRHWLLPIE